MRFRILNAIFAVLLVSFAAHAETMIIGGDACDAVTRYQAEESDAIYKPGVDVDGDEVVSADLNATKQPDIGTVKLDIKLPETAHHRYANEILVTQADINVKENKVYLFGEEIGKDDQAELIGACRNVSHETKKIKEEAKPPKSAK